MLEKTYRPEDVEARLYQMWQETGAFEAGRPERAGAEPYTIVIPPPNVTGSLHMGHALNNTLQDVLCRFERMRGRDVLWQPGMDHAGIATQMVVERELANEGNESRREMGREAFLERVWTWKEQSGGTIVNQLKRLGASCDWRRDRFTMDDGFSKAVTRVFVELHRKGLIYRDKRLVNWDPQFQTAISDLEVVPTEVDGHLWHFRYPLADGVTYEHPVAFDEDGAPTAFETRDFIEVATTRPETMLGDTGVAVHPEDPRYQPLIGKDVILPLVGRRIPIVGDTYADPEAGSGAVKITPAHDFNDFEVGKRAGLRQINILDEFGRILLVGNEAFLEGLDAEALAPLIRKLDQADRFVARKQIVELMDDAGALGEIEPHRHAVPYGDRSNVVIEPYLTDQWYVDAETLAKPAIASVEEGRTKFVPENWSKTYFEWMRNIQPWCISRQLWWGHRIPAWYGPDGEIFVALSEEEAAAAAAAHYGKKVDLSQDEDVLDTWFSSGLWPFGTLGWPEETPELARFYPTNTLVTGFDIIFFWVARMMMMGLEFTGKEPFDTVYIHALVRDEKGQKMSKSKGNVMDPLDLVDKFGADALRFTLAAMAAQGRDIKLSEQRVEGYRNFGTKLWNAARFCEMNGCERVDGFDPAGVDLTLNKWIVGEAARAAAAVTAEIEAYRFNEAAGALYRFIWNVFCDWYLEFAKPALNGEEAAAKAETQATAAWTLDQILKLLHPFMPFVSEELWQRTGETGPARETQLILADWPHFDGLGDAGADTEMEWLIALISEIRSVRAEMNVPAGARLPLLVRGASADTEARIERHREVIGRLARLERIETTADVPAGAVQTMVGEAELFLPLGDVIDFAAETERLRKEVAKIDGELKKLMARLGNEKFIANAPEEVIAEQRERQADAEAVRAKLADALVRLENAG